MPRTINRMECDLIQKTIWSTFEWPILDPHFPHWDPFLAHYRCQAWKKTQIGNFKSLILLEFYSAYSTWVPSLGHSRIDGSKVQVALELIHSWCAGPCCGGPGSWFSTRQRPPSIWRLTILFRQRSGTIIKIVFCRKSTCNLKNRSL